MAIKIITGNPAAHREPEPLIPEAEVAGIVAPPPQAREVVSIAQLCHECNEQSSKMSVTNPNKRLLLSCAYAMQQLVQRLEFSEGKAKPQ